MLQCPLSLVFGLPRYFISHNWCARFGRAAVGVNTQSSVNNQRLVNVGISVSCVKKMVLWVTEGIGGWISPWTGWSREHEMHCPLQLWTTAAAPMLPFACQRLLKRVSQMAQDVLLLVTWETNQAMACPSYKDLPMRERERERERETDRQADRQTDR